MRKCNHCVDGVVQLFTSTRRCEYCVGTGQLPDDPHDAKPSDEVPALIDGSRVTAVKAGLDNLKKLNSRPKYADIGKPAGWVINSEQTEGQPQIFEIKDQEKLDSFKAIEKRLSSGSTLIPAVAYLVNEEIIGDSTADAISIMSQAEQRDWLIMARHHCPDVRNALRRRNSRDAIRSTFCSLRAIPTTPIEEANMIRSLIECHKMTIPEIADSVNKSVVFVAGRLRLLGPTGGTYTLEVDGVESPSFNYDERTHFRGKVIPKLIDLHEVGAVSFQQMLRLAAQSRDYQVGWAEAVSENILAKQREQS